MKISRILALGAFFVAMAVALTACGGDSASIPGNAVAKVGDNTISKSDFDHWMKVAAISSAGSAEPDKAGASASVPDAVYEPGRSQLTVRLPEQPGEQFAAVVRAADALLNVVSGPAPAPV